MSGRPPYRRSEVALVIASLTLLVGCTAAPRYPVDSTTAPGEGFQPIAPHYPIAGPAPSPDSRVDTPIAARASASGDAGYAPSRGDGGGGGVEEAPLRPVSRAGRRPEAEPRSTSVSRAGSTDDPTVARVRRVPGALTYTLARHDTLYGIARRFGVGPLALASANGLNKASALQPGLRIKLPSDSRDGGEQAHATGTAARAAARIVTLTRPARPIETAPRRASNASSTGPIPYDQLVGRSRTSARRDRPGPSIAAAPSSAPDRADAALPHEGGEPPPDRVVESAARGRFIRPVRGETLSSFGVKGPGQRNDGVDLAAREGEVVRASASGVVVYAGHDVPALGNLVAVKHADGWVTVYGNLEKITVKPTERLSQGAALGVAGATRVTPTPQVHFEVRYAPDPAEKAHPVDPDLVLPKAE